MAIVSLTIGALFTIGCAGTPATVDSFGNIKPEITIFQPWENNTTANWFKLSSLTFLPLFSWDSSANRPVINNFWTYQTPTRFGLPYNPDASLTLFKFGNLPLKIMPMTYKRF